MNNNESRRGQGSTGNPDHSDPGERVAPSSQGKVTFSNAGETRATRGRKRARIVEVQGPPTKRDLEVAESFARGTWGVGWPD